jgi:5-methylcytosine-specific restriction endonuclease McrA
VAQLVSAIACHAIGRQFKSGQGRVSDMKKCTKCGEEKPATTEYFRMNGNRMRADCIGCTKKVINKWYEKNKHKQREVSRQWHHNNKQRASETSRQWYENNKEYWKKRARQWAKDNPEKRREHHAKRRAIKKGAAVGEPFTAQDVLDKWGTDCHICKKPIDPLDWHMDHVVALVNGGEHSLDNVKPSHPKCNLSKGKK